MRTPHRMLLVVCALSAGLAGCQMGPVAMRANRTQYNIAVQQTANEQFLLNIVRLRYREMMSFLELNAINSSYKFNLNSSFSIIDPIHDTPKASGTSGGSRAGSIAGAYSEEPTFSYSPVHGEQFVKRVLTDIDLGTMGLLLRSGWHIDTVLRLLVQKIGPLPNEPTQGCRPGQTLPPHDAFVKAVHWLRLLQKKGDLQVHVRADDEVVAVVPADKFDIATALVAHRENYKLVRGEGGQMELRKSGQPAIVLEVDWKAKETHEALALLGVKSDPSQPEKKIRLCKSAGKPAPDVVDIPVQLRSFVNVLFYLAQGVEVPQDDLRTRRVKPYTREGDPAFDRRKCTMDLLDVRCSLLPPMDAMVSVCYRGLWFYLADSDTDSKDTFALVGYLFAIQAGETKGSAPTLVLPIGK